MVSGPAAQVAQQYVEVVVLVTPIAVAVMMKTAAAKMAFCFHPQVVETAAWRSVAALIQNSVALLEDSLPT